MQLLCFKSSRKRIIYKYSLIVNTVCSPTFVLTNSYIFSLVAKRFRVFLPIIKYWLFASKEIYFLGSSFNMKKYIFDVPTLRNVSDMNVAIPRIEWMFTNPGYLWELHKTEKNWLDIPDDAVLKRNLAFIKRITL